MRGPDSDAPDAKREALRHYVRARAADFGADERRDRDAWLDADASHRAEYALLERTWQQLDGLAGHLQIARHSARDAARPPRRRWHWALGGAIATGVTFALVAAMLPSAAVKRHFETAVAQHSLVKIGAGIEVSLNADTAIDITEGKVPRLDLSHGDIYVDVHQANGSDGLEVRVGRARIRDIGTRFAVAATAAGGSVAVEQGRVELRAGRDLVVIDAGRRAAFDAEDHVSAGPVASLDIAPWRENRWRFQATSLAVLATELARQQRIRVDFADPAVASLTVNGSFGFAEPERVLWAVAQVHGLKLERLGERHFQLRRG